MNSDQIYWWLFSLFQSFKEINITSASMGASVATQVINFEPVT